MEAGTSSKSFSSGDLNFINIKETIKDLKDHIPEGEIIHESLLFQVDMIEKDFRDKVKIIIKQREQIDVLEDAFHTLQNQLAKANAIIDTQVMLKHVEEYIKQNFDKQRKTR